MRPTCIIMMRAVQHMKAGKGNRSGEGSSPAGRLYGEGLTEREHKDLKEETGWGWGTLWRSGG